MANIDDFNLNYPFDRRDLDPTKLHVTFRSKRDGTSAQCELRGKVKNPNDESDEVTNRDFIEKTINYRLRYCSSSDNAYTVVSLLEKTPIDDQEKVRILATKSSSQVSLAQVFASLLLLPEPSGREKSSHLPTNGLVHHGYWIELIDFELVDYPNNGSKECTLDAMAVYIATNQRSYKGAKKLDLYNRLSNLTSALSIIRNNHSSNKLLCDAVDYYISVYSGKKPFVYQTGVFATKIIMEHFSYLFEKIECTFSSDPYDVLTRLVSLAEQDAEAVNIPRVAFSSEQINKPRNLIYFGAPGTGKSHSLQRDAEAQGFEKQNIRRVTFHPDYTYSQFVGCFKPYSSATEGGYGVDGGESIAYRFVPGPFIEIYQQAYRNRDKNYLLIIEEINRSNPAAVFGDLFQILDRNTQGFSKYDIATPFEMREYLRIFLPAGKSKLISQNTLVSEYDQLLEESEHLSLPPNLYIWATMNSADQGVFPMDTAFKRRWDFRYMGINESEDATPSELDGKKLNEHTVEICGGRVVWNELRKAINVLLLDNGVNEDKLLGPFFLAPDMLSDEPYGDEGSSRFMTAFKDKALLYLYEDAGKMKRRRIFQNEDATFAEIRDQFMNRGIEVFKKETDKHSDIFDGVFASVEESGITDEDNED